MELLPTAVGRLDGLHPTLVFSATEQTMVTGLFFKQIANLFKRSNHIRALWKTVETFNQKVRELLSLPG